MKHLTIKQRYTIFVMFKKIIISILLKRKKNSKNEKNEKNFLIILLISTNLQLFSQSEFYRYLTAADKHFKNSDYTNAYTLYFNLWDKNTFPDADLKILSQRLEVTRNQIDSIQIATGNYIKQEQQKQREFEL